MTTLTELQVGESLEEHSINSCIKIDLIKYAGASGDYNPIHTIDEEARESGIAWNYCSWNVDNG